MDVKREMEGQKRTGRMKCYCRHRMHVRFSDVFNHNGDIIIPCSDGFVVRGCDEPSILVNECNGIYRTQVLIVFLCDFTRVHVILTMCKLKEFENKRSDTNLNNLLIRHSGKEDMLFVLVWMESYDVRNLPIAKPFDTLTGFSVPQLDRSVVTAR